MSTSFVVLTPPSVEPITLTDVKDWLNIDFSDKDVLLASLISRARSYAETVTHRALASQQIQQTFAIERPQGGELSGPINRGPSWYEYNEELGANPFGASQFYYDLAMPPIDTSQALTIETKVTAFDTWKVFPQITNPDGSTNTWVDSASEPARLYIQSPITANFYRFTYWTGFRPGYELATRESDIQNCLFELVGMWYDNREGEGTLAEINKRLLARRVDWV